MSQQRQREEAIRRARAVAARQKSQQPEQQQTPYADTREARNERNAEAAARADIMSSGAEAANSLGPQVRFQDLSTPIIGSQPGGATPQNAGPRNPEDFIGGQMPQAPPQQQSLPEQGLEDDYYDAMSQAGLADQANPNHMPPPPQNPNQGGRGRGNPPIRRQSPLREEHPILKSLKADFGLEDLPTFDAEVSGHTFTLGTVDNRELGIVARFVDIFSETMSEREFVTNVAIVAASIRAIDGVPVYKVFGVDVPHDMRIKDPMFPPRSVRTAAMAEVFEMIFENSKNQLVKTLYDIYAEQLDPKSEVVSYMNDPSKPRFRYQGAHGYELVDFPRYDVEGNELPYFCKLTGQEMEKVAKVVSGQDLPLS